ncbi:class I SAM-dependent methyltransferase [Mesorhizobium sp. BH1-1-4]|uniref:class I SAM-dependent methyltransferase n=1 Tax=Mesorhizobium sp. BH1-1-4 TaxID=2876662 RepID=UPI001CD0AB0E|nr:class I SAM-dependent methyltransferase [Mesorhizobium sp. BH1-1-4]MBZ9997323.1 class I SAM-dependent methyltransferase [Mesorhizobium sp. BH1-1-4]
MNKHGEKVENIDSIYYRDGVKNSISMRLLKTARMSIMNLFMRELDPDEYSRILDIGVSDDENDGANFLEKHYPWQHNITCVGLGDGKEVLSNYPKVRFKQIRAGERLPFEDKSFDIACSNAVIEHVGGPAQRTAFISEHLRVAKKVFISFPNRWFPVEHHTGLPFIHYSPGSFRWLLKGTKYDYWVNPENMDFLDKRTVMMDWPRDKMVTSRIFNTGINLGPFSSNCAIVVK